MIHRFFMWLADLIDPVDPGEWTATAAKLRLQDVVAADRAAVPCGRWVKVHDEFRIPALGIGVKAQYRWSERR